MAAIYPPDRHLLRDLRFSFDELDDGTTVARMPVVPEVCGDDGSVRAGVVATLVDVIGGGVAARAAHPGWIATADLTLHLAAAVRDGTVEARAHVLRAGRTTVVLEVTLHDDGDREVGIATMSFSVLPRRDINPDIEATREPGPSTMALPGSRMPGALLDVLGVQVVDARRGELAVPITDWTLNSMGAMQGGVVATVVDAAAETALRAAGACAGEAVVTDIEVTYLSFGKIGPVRSRTEVLEASPERGSAHVELFDTGAGDRRMVVARAGVTRRSA
jgi:uncharacterized protein (TIGR00369 family)